MRPDGVTGLDFDTFWSGRYWAPSRKCLNIALVQIETVTPSNCLRHTVSNISYEILIFSTLRRKLLGGFKMFLNMPILTMGHVWSKENLK